MIGDDGEQYVTVVQDGQTYAIPVAEYQTMQASGGTITIQPPPQTIIADQQPVLVPAPPPPPPQQTAKSSGSSIKWGMSGGPQQHIHAKPWSSNNQQQQFIVDVKRFKPIRVDNWGIFLLNRLQAYFQKKEHCDLTIRFPHRNAQIKVHKLVVNACTDYFVQMEKAGLIKDGEMDMPDHFTPDAVAPIIRFMYTGRLDMKPGMFGKLHDTADALQMAVLTKLMDAQLNDAPAQLQHPSNKKKAKRRKEDPVKQMRQIKRIEKKFEKMHRQQKVEEKIKQQQAIKQETEDMRLPGKKLPIWKKRETSAVEEVPVVTGVEKQTPPQNQENQKDKDGEIEIEEEMVAIKQEPRAYGKTNKMGAKVVPRQIREIQEHLTFEKIRKTGVRNVVGAAGGNEKEDRDMTVEEIKEFMNEQRKRLALGDGEEEDDDDDYYDNDAEMDYGGDEEEEEEWVAATPAEINAPPTKPILKTPDSNNTTTNSYVPRKSVRFSLRPGSVPTPKGIDDEPETITSDPVTLEEEQGQEEAIVASPPKKRGRPKKLTKTPDRDVVDTTVEEFSRAVEQEEEENARIDLPKTRTTRRAIARQASPQTKVTTKKTAVQAPDKAQVVSELLKKHPELFKDNKPVKVKIMAKDASGKSVLQYITVRTQDIGHQSPLASTASPAASTASPAASTTTPAAASTPTTTTPPQALPQSAEAEAEDELNSSLGLRCVPKVKYTGKRGRPPIIKPGEIDPHADVRSQIEERLQKAVVRGQKIVIHTDKQVGEETFTTFEQVAGKLVQIGHGETLMDPSQLDPSSEAEALSTVASGIAASLGLVNTDQSSSTTTTTTMGTEFSGSLTNEDEPVATSGPLADLEHFENQGQTYPETEATTKEAAADTKPQRGVKRTRSSSEINPKEKKVSKLAMDWEEDEDTK